MPVEVLQDDKLTTMQKFLFCEISSLCGMNGCHASNAHFAQLLGISERSVRRNLQALKNQNYISCKVVRNDKNEVVSRSIDVRKIDYKIPPDANVHPPDAEVRTPPDADGLYLRTQMAYIDTIIDSKIESTGAQEVFDLNETLVEKIDKAPSPLEKMLNSITYRSKFEALAKKYLKSKTTEAALKEMSVQMKQQKNYHRWYKSERTIFEKFEAYFISPTAFAQYKK